MARTEAKLALFCFLGEWLSQVHFRHRPSERLRVGPAAHVKIFHDQVRATVKPICIMVHLRNGEAARGAERLES